MISKELEISLSLAVTEATRWRHEYVTVEHVLYALLQDKVAREAIIACGGSIDLTRDRLEGFFKEKLEVDVLQKGKVPQPTVGFQRVLQRAAQHVLSAGKEKIYGDAVLVSILAEKESFANYFLLQQNVKKFDVINFFSHGNAEESDYQSTEPGRVPPSIGAGTSSEEHPDSEPEQEREDEDGEGRQKANALRTYTVDLVARAKAGKIDPLIGREIEIERTIQILCRRRKNNPLFVGDSGVGKTALAEGLALRICDDQVPEILKGAKIYALDLGLMLAGSKFRGDFEQRLKNLIKLMSKIPKAILFIDEIHTVIGAGAVGGSAMDASNILKPALSAGELRCIGSTTFREYRQHFENDQAMSRRFQRIDIDEPSVEDTIKILKGLKSHYEDFHNVKYSSEAIRAAAELSSKHLRDKKLPDKAIDVIDEVGAFYALKAETRKSEKRRVIGVADIKATIAKIARIPEQRMSRTDKESLSSLKDSLRAVVFGQDAAIEAVDTAIKLSRSGLGDENKPIGSFMFSGPTGVGKTELAKQLASVLGIEFIRFDMSEYMERHAVARLIGAPPGYVGYEDGGLLTDKVNKTPHAVLLLDEIEKAHSDVHNILLQIMDHGTLTDATGRETDFRNVILVLTTNVGASEMARGMIGFTRKTGGDEGKDQEAIKKAFSPEFRNRLDAMISFGSLPESVILKIVDKFLKDIEGKLAAKRVKLSVSELARKYLGETGYQPAYGARPLGRLIQDKIKRPLADQLISGELKSGGEVKIDLKDGALTFDFHAAL
jgi:ATP-dependent Clp protease ATP-binding subunit ClpA